MLAGLADERWVGIRLEMLQSGVALHRNGLQEFVD